MSGRDCVYCGHELAREAESCPSCGEAVDMEPGEKSEFAQRYSSCCRSRASFAGMLAGIIAVCSWLIFVWLPVGTSPLVKAAVLLPGMFVGAVLGVYMVALLAFLLSMLSSGNDLSAGRDLSSGKA